MCCSLIAATKHGTAPHHFSKTHKITSNKALAFYIMYIYILHKEGVISLSAKSQRIPLAIGVSVEMT
jgi:hypothetical protein